MHTGLARRSPGWRVRIAVLAAALVGAAAAATAWHGDHVGDRDCAVCQLRQQPVAELSGDLEIGPADGAERLQPLASGDWTASDRPARLPARAPPA